MGSEPTVTVVIPFYGDPRETAALIAELRRRPARSVAAIVVSDDCSPEPFPADGGAASAQPDDAQAPPVVVVRRERNGGFGAAVNTGLDEVRTPLALVLNSDLRIDGPDIDALVEAAEPWQPAVVSAQVLDPEGDPQHSGRHFPTVSHQVVEWLTPLARWRELPVLHEAVGHDLRSVRSPDPVAVDWVMGALMLLPVEQVRAVGGFDEHYHMNCEEVDLQRRLRRLGVPSVVVPSVTAVHIGGGSSDPALRRRWLVDARFRYAALWGRPRVLAAGLAAASAVNLAVNGARRAAGRPVHPLSVFAEEAGLIREGIRCAC